MRVRVRDGRVTPPQTATQMIGTLFCLPLGATCTIASHSVRLLKAP
jgi:hypothetical protein